MAAAGETPALTGRGYCRAGEGARATKIIGSQTSCKVGIW